MNPRKSYPIVLSIAGSDSSGGAGIQADLKTFAAIGVYGATAITALTAQNTLGVHSQLAINPQMVYDQIVAVIDDLHPSVVKIGMLSNAEVVNAVAEALSHYPLTVILDPVMVSSSGHRLLSVEAQEVVKQRLLPISALVTPNIPEMEALANISLSNYADKERAAAYILSCGAKAILLKGGHEEGEVKSDILFTMSAAGIETSIFTSATISTHNTHGTGCTLSAAIASYMARGYAMCEAISQAKVFITEAIRAGADIEIGHGIGPVNHGYNPQKMEVYYVE
ncbi:MAG: bifunctional hydroxymethylpyrimidine kinase/phosphomethylpyrimidine kinase [Alistipes sp.]|nr:bifunctional hydroxymethylpyrimidine kinase/phosphomethylpyrimidine kinase [Alistipes sp.]